MRRKKQPFTLLEIMIVILLIGIIASVIGFNMKGSLDTGKKFKTEQAAAQIRDILLMEAAKNNIPLKDVVANPAKFLEESGIVKDVDKLLKDGWGNDFKIEVTDHNNDIYVSSSKLK